MAGNITRWSPFGDVGTSDLGSGLLSLRHAMDRLFQDAFVRPSEFFGSTGNGQSSLAMDVYETENDCVVTAAIPGVRPEDVEITVQGDVLTVKAEAKTEQESEKGTYHLRERRVSSLFRQLRLPVAVETDKADARFENGILTLRLPKAAEARERRIRIQAGRQEVSANKGA